MNQATHEYKEQMKVGYNLRRKVVLHGGLGAVAAAAARRPDAVRRCSQPHTDVGELAAATCRRSGCRSASAALLFRTVQLFFLRDVQTGLVWVTKILTDPFHDIMLYHRAPLYLLRGELIDPIARRRVADGRASLAQRLRRLIDSLVSAGVVPTTSRPSRMARAAATNRSATSRSRHRCS